MRILVTLAVEIDAEMWQGGELKGKELRDDVKSYILTSVQGSAMVEEADGSVELR